MMSDAAPCTNVQSCTAISRASPSMPLVFAVFGHLPDHMVEAIVAPCLHQFGGLEFRVLSEHEAEQGLFLDRECDIGPAHGRNAFKRPAAGRFDGFHRALCQKVEAARGDFFEDFLLVPEVPVGRCRADPAQRQASASEKFSAPRSSTSEAVAWINASRKSRDGSGPCAVPFPAGFRHCQA